MKLEDEIITKVKLLTKTITEILPNNKEYSLDFDNENDERIIDVFDKDKRKIMSVNYEILGTYDFSSKIFNWGCNKNIVDKKLTKMSKNIKSESKTIKKYIVEKKYTDVAYLESIYYYLTNPLFFVDDISYLIKFSIYASECKGVLISMDTYKGVNIQTCYLITDIISF